MCHKRQANACRDGKRLPFEDAVPTGLHLHTVGELGQRGLRHTYEIKQEYLVKCETRGSEQLIISMQDQRVNKVRKQNTGFAQMTPCNHHLGVFVPALYLHADSLLNFHFTPSNWKCGHQFGPNQCSALLRLSFLSEILCRVFLLNFKGTKSQ